MSQEVFEAQSFVELRFLPEQRLRPGTVLYKDGAGVVVACEPEDAKRLQPGGKVQLTQVLNDNVYETETAIFRVQNNHFTAPLPQPRLVERRRSRRISCDLAATYQTRALLSEEEASQLQSDEVRMHIRDLSMGGALAWCGQIIPINVAFPLILSLADSLTVTVEAEALRCTMLKPNEIDKARGLYFEASLKFHQVARIDQMQLQRFLLLQSADSQ